MKVNLRFNELVKTKFFKKVESLILLTIYLFISILLNSKAIKVTFQEDWMVLRLIDSISVFLDNYIKFFLPKYVWSDFLSSKSFGFNYLSSRLYFVFIGKILNLTTSELAIIVRIFVQVISFWGIYILARYYLFRFSCNYLIIVLSSFVAGLFYGLSPSFMIGDLSRPFIELAYAFLPWIIWSFNKVILNKNWKYIIICVLLMVINIDEHFLWAGFPIILCLYAGFIFGMRVLKEKKLDIYVLYALFAVLLIFMLLNINNLIVRLNTFSSHSYALTKTGLDICWKQASILNMLRAMSHVALPNLYVTDDSVFNFLSSLMPVTLIIPVIAFLSLLYYKKKSWVTLFYSIFLILSTLPFFVGSPFKWIHYWIFFNLPIGPAFRTWRVPDAYIALSLSVLIAFFLYYTFERLRKKRYIVIACAFILFVFCVYSWPLLTGDVNGALSLIKVPNEYIKVYNFLTLKTGNSRVIYLPEFHYSYGRHSALKPFWSPKLGMIPEFLYSSSPKPTLFLPSQWNHFYFFTLSPFYSSLLTLGDIKTLSYFLKIANIKYIVIHNDIFSLREKINNLIDLLKSSSYFKLVFHSGFIYVFENNLDTQVVSSFSQNILVGGGLKAMQTLIFANNIKEQPFYSLLFSDFMVLDSFILKNISTIISTKANNQFLYDLILERVNNIIYPYKYVNNYNPYRNWSRASFLDPHQQEWHIWIRKFDNYAWDYDFGKGIIFTIGSQDILKIPIKIDLSDLYVCLIRYFANNQGGKFFIKIGNSTKEVASYSDYNGFVWTKFLVNLNESAKFLEIKNLSGFNAINCIFLVPIKNFYKILNSFENKLTSKEFIYLLEAEYDLYRGNVKVPDIIFENGSLLGTPKVIKDPELSNGEALEFYPDHKAWQTIEIVKEGYYRLGLRLKGEFAVKIGNYSFNMNSPLLDTKYTPPFYLKKGKYYLQITPRSGRPLLDVVYLFSVPKDKLNATLEDLFKVKELPAQLKEYKKINPTLWKVKVKAEKPFMLSFAEAYDPLWEARIYKNGKKVKTVKSIPLYGVINGFWIDETGDLEIVIRYKPQDWFEIGLAISALTFLGCIGYLVYDWRRDGR